MLAFYYARKILIISLITIILDGIISYYVPSYLNNINYFYPMLTIAFLPFISYTNKKYLYWIVIIIGSIYDILYSNIFLYNVLIFIILVDLNYKISKYFKNNLCLLIVLALLNIIVYDAIGFLLVFLSGYEIITITDLIYKIEHSIILNIMSVFVLWFLLRNDLVHA